MKKSIFFLFVFMLIFTSTYAYARKSSRIIITGTIQFLDVPDTFWFTETMLELCDGDKLYRWFDRDYINSGGKTIQIHLELSTTSGYLHGPMPRRVLLTVHPNIYVHYKMTGQKLGGSTRVYYDIAVQTDFGFKRYSGVAVWVLDADNRFLMFSLED